MSQYVEKIHRERLNKQKSVFDTGKMLKIHRLAHVLAICSPYSLSRQSYLSPKSPYSFEYILIKANYMICGRSDKMNWNSETETELKNVNE